MNKKIMGVIVFLIILIGVLPSTISVKSYQESLIENLENNENVIDYQIKGRNFFQDYTVMIDPISYPDFKGVPYPILEDLPKEFSWRTYNGKDWTTPAKNQGSCGSCWAFAALGVLESMVEIREGNADINPDFSEQYVLSCLPEAGSCRGGRAWVALELIQDDGPSGNNANGIIFEECFPYQADDDIPCDDKCPNWMDQLVPISNWGSWEADGTSEDREAIKSYIIENGPVVSHMKATDLFKAFGAVFHNPNLYFPRLRRAYSVNHVVMIVGWKDLPNVPSGGYWICKNSWGTDWGYDGFVNIAYGSLNIDGSLIVWADYDPDSFDWPPNLDTSEFNEVYLEKEINFNASESFEYNWIFNPESEFNQLLHQK